MRSFLPIEPGQYVLAWRPEFYVCEGEGDMPEALARLQYRGAGWESMPAYELFAIRQVLKVMPKTYHGVEHVVDAAPMAMRMPTIHKGRREFRDMIIAVAAAPEDLVKLRDELFAIGHEADDAIEKEAQRLVAPFAEEVYAAAAQKIRTAVPHHFGDAS